MKNINPMTLTGILFGLVGIVSIFSGDWLSVGIWLTLAVAMLVMDPTPSDSPGKIRWNRRNIVSMIFTAVAFTFLLYQIVADFRA